MLFFSHLHGKCGVPKKLYLCCCLLKVLNVYNVSELLLALDVGHAAIQSYSKSFR